MYPLRQVFFVFGLSKSGKAAAEFLLAKGAIVYVYDEIDSERIRQTILTLEGLGAKRVDKSDIAKMPSTCDVLVLSPGIPIDHSIAIEFKKRKKSIVGESELAARYLRCPILAVTGTNGKTTTVSLLTDVLTRGGYHAKACGNIGTPMLDCCDFSEKDVAVAEISSFQLETLNSLCPHVAVVLNVTEDHLNRHYNMDNYVYLKAKLLKNCTESEYAVLNYDDQTVRTFAGQTKAKTLFFSIREQVKGAFYENGELYFAGEKIMPVSELAIGGLHNVQNALAVICVAKIMGIKISDIRAALSDFKGIRHRIEKVAMIDGVDFINDSKGTNVDATIQAILTMKTDTVLLLGGQNKGYDYAKLFTAIKNSKVVHAILYGENRYALLKSAREQSFDNITVCDGFHFAVQVAVVKAKVGQTVLLSPASASFDEFSNYEERGERFVEILQSYMPKEGEEIKRQDVATTIGDGVATYACDDEEEIE